MNGLVGYDSSDSEHETETVQKLPAEFSVIDSTNHVQGSPNGTPERSDIPDDDDNKPVVGPLLEYQLHSEEKVLSTSTDDPALTELSGSDQLRYLTQPERPAALDFLEPTVPANPSTTAQFKRFIALKAQGKNFNAELTGRTWFKNPNVLVGLMEQHGLEQREMYAVSADLGDGCGTGLLPDWVQNGGLHEVCEARQRSSKIQEEQDRKSMGGRIEFVKATLDG